MPYPMPAVNPRVCPPLATDGARALAALAWANMYPDDETRSSRLLFIAGYHEDADARLLAAWHLARLPHPAE